MFISIDKTPDVKNQLELKIHDKEPYSDLRRLAYAVINY